MGSSVQAMAFDLLVGMDLVAASLDLDHAQAAEARGNQEGQGREETGPFLRLSANEDVDLLKGVSGPPGGRQVREVILIF